MNELDPTVGRTESKLEPEQEDGGVAVEVAPSPGNGATAAPTAEEDADVVSGRTATIGDPTVTDRVSALGGAAPSAGLVGEITGRYRSSGGPVVVDLRVDVEGAPATRRVSADYYSVIGGTVTYRGSMRVDAVSVSASPTRTTITGRGTYTWPAAAPRVRITIPRDAPEEATLQHLTVFGTTAATFSCERVSPFLRSILFEQDRQDTVPAAFVSYATGSLPSGGPGRTLSVASAFAEAGVELQTAGVVDVVNTSEAGVNGTWSDAELHAAMVRHFSLWRDLPQWAVWLFHAKRHDLGPTLLGIMFDQAGRQRQGAAVFYQSLAGTTADRQRLQLYTCTHELGHCFNLLHSWEKSLGSPPVPDRPNSLSWMNYPWRYPLGGPGAFWSGFGFRFDAQELIHLRHAFRDSLIMGGKPFGVGTALEAPEGWRDPIEDNSGLKLELRAPRSFAFGMPVSIDLELSATDSRGRRVPQRLRPRNGNVDIAIEQPSGRLLVYRPLLHQCAQDDIVTIDADTPGLTETAFVHYGKDGFYFADPGTYRVRARTVAEDGSSVLSNVLEVRVQPPVTREDYEAAELVFGDEQGTLMYLVGSDFEGLAAGNDALADLRDRFPQHPLADLAGLVQGVNAAREFKHVLADNSVTVRPPQPEEGGELVAAAVDVEAVRSAGRAEEGLDSMRKAAAMRISETATTNVRPDIAAYVKARRREIAVEVSGASE